jgi:hypothetical protein
VLTITTVVLYGLSRTLLMHGVGDEDWLAFESFVKHTDPNIQSHKILVDTNVDKKELYACFCYINYENEADALKGRQLFETAIYHALTTPGPVDASRMHTCLKSQAPKSRWGPVFSVWVGDVTSADEVRAKFNSFGRLTTVTLTSHGLPPFKIDGGPRQSAIVNYIRFEDAQTALLEPNTSARTNTLFVQRVLSEKPKSLKQVERIASKTMDRPEHYVALLQTCTGLFDFDGHGLVL